MACTKDLTFQTWVYEFGEITQIVVCSAIKTADYRRFMVFLWGYFSLLNKVSSSDKLDCKVQFPSLYHPKFIVCSLLCYFEVILKGRNDVDFLFVILLLHLLCNTLDCSLDIGLFGIYKHSQIVWILCYFKCTLY